MQLFFYAQDRFRIRGPGGDYSGEQRASAHWAFFNSTDFYQLGKAKTTELVTTFDCHRPGFVFIDADWAFL